MRCCSPGWSTGSSSNLRRCAGYTVQYFAAVEPQKRLAPHLHAALRGAIPHQVIRQVAAATYLQVWWPPFDQPVYSRPAAPLGRHRLRRPGHRGGPADLAAGAGPARRRPGRATGACGAVRHAGRLGRDHRPLGGCGPGDPYLTKYLTKSIAAHLHRQRGRSGRRMRRTLTGCTRSCGGCPVVSAARTGCGTASNPRTPCPGLRPGCCLRKAHERENLGLGGRRVLVSRQWSGKTLGEHRADRATVVREALEAAGMLAPEIERMAATVLAAGWQTPVRVDRHPTRPDHLRPGADEDHRRTDALARPIPSRERPGANGQDGPGDNCSTTGPAP